MGHEDVDVVVPSVRPGRVETGPLAHALDVVAEVGDEGDGDEPARGDGRDPEIGTEAGAAVAGAGGVNVHGVHPGPVPVVVPEGLDDPRRVDGNPGHHLVVPRRIVVDPDRGRPARPLVRRACREDVPPVTPARLPLHPDGVEIAAVRAGGGVDGQGSDLQRVLPVEADAGREKGGGHGPDHDLRVERDAAIEGPPELELRVQGEDVVDPALPENVDLVVGAHYRIADLDRLRGAALQDQRRGPGDATVDRFDDLDVDLRRRPHVPVHESGIGHVERVGRPVAGDPLLDEEVVRGAEDLDRVRPAQVDAREGPDVDCQRRVVRVGLGRIEQEDAGIIELAVAAGGDGGISQQDVGGTAGREPPRISEGRSPVGGVGDAAPPVRVGGIELIEADDHVAAENGDARLALGARNAAAGLDFRRGGMGPVEHRGVRTGDGPNGLGALRMRSCREGNSGPAPERLQALRSGILPGRPTHGGRPC